MPVPAVAQEDAEGAGVPVAQRPAVGVLPFIVHSGQPIDYLGESLADLLRTRLEAGGKLRVLDAAASGGLPRSQPGETRDAALRRAARGLGVEYVVTGSLTELAGRYDLAVRVTPSAIGLESHTQVYSAQQDEELLGRVNQIAERVTEQIAGAAPALVAAVEIVGAAGFEEQLQSRLRTRSGEPYDPLSVRSDLSALRANPAVVSARAETLRGESGVVVRFDLVLADPTIAGEGLGVEDRVAILEVRGNRRIESDAIRARIASKPGSRFDPAQLGRDIAEVHSLGFFRDVRVLTEPGPDGRIVVFEVEENPVVRQISISGNDNIDSEKIRDGLTLTTGSTLDYPLLFENRMRIEGMYRAQGYYLASVGFEIEPLGEASVGIHFEVEEKDKLKLRKIEFSGNEHFSDGDLAEGFQTKVWRFWSYATSWFDRSGTYSEPLFVQDLRGVEKKYTDAGFLQMELGEPDVIPSEDGLTVIVNITEGRRFSVGSLDVVGDSTVDIDALRGKLRLREGNTFNRSHLTQDIASLTQHYQDRGFYFAQVTPLSNLSEATEEVDIVFDVRKGPLYFIRKIEIEGNTITVDPVIRREVPIVEGQLYSQRAVLLARSKVQRLGFFEEVDLQMEPTDEPDQLDMKVSVVERPTGSFSFGAGFSDFGGRTQRFFINLSDPHFLGSSFSLGGTVSRTNVRFDSFDQEQLGASVVLGHALTEDNRTRGFLRYSFDLRRLADSSNVNAASVIFREVIQDVLSSSLVGFSAIQDTRDDLLAPTSGRRLALSLEGAGLGGFSKFVRLEGRGAWFFGAPRFLPKRSSFVFAARMGWAHPLNLIGDFDTIIPTLDDLGTALGSDQIAPLIAIDTDLTLPLTERYFLGGLGQFQLRGFKARSVGPRRAILRLAGQDNTVFTPVGRDPITGECQDTSGTGNQGNQNGICNDIDTQDIEDFADLDETDVIGGNKFVSSSFEYRFPISETVGLQGVVFLDMGNSFAENDWNLFDVTKWRYGTGAGVQWFSPFGPLAVVLGFPLDKLSIEKSPVFEFSVGGGAF
jgi:outer membrane protein insertion porin family